MIRVLIADDHAVVRQGLRTFLDLQDDIEVVAEADDGAAAVDAAARTKPDVILLDLVMPNVDGVGALKRLREAGSRARVIVLTSFGDDDKLILNVSDDGCGFDPEGPEVRGQRLGLTSMEERATELGGTLQVTSTLGEGTTIRLEAPDG